MQRVALGTTTAGRLVIKTPQRLPLLQQVQEAFSDDSSKSTASGREALALDIKSKSHGVRIAATSIVYIITGRRSARRADSIRGNEYCVPPTQAFQFANQLEAARAIVHIWRVSWLA